MKWKDEELDCKLQRTKLNLTQEPKICQSKFQESHTQEIGPSLSWTWFKLHNSCLTRLSSGLALAIIFFLLTQQRQIMFSGTKEHSLMLEMFFILIWGVVHVGVYIFIYTYILKHHIYVFILRETVKGLGSGSNRKHFKLQPSHLWAEWLWIII